MQKQYRDIGTLIDEFGFSEAVSYKFLELRDRFHLADRIFSEFIIGHSSSSAYSRSYIAHWDAKGKLVYFNSNPNYPQDFRPINPETFEPMPKLTEAELKERLPTEFAHNISQILVYEK